MPRSTAIGLTQPSKFPSNMLPQKQAFGGWLQTKAQGFSILANVMNITAMAVHLILVIAGVGYTSSIKSLTK